jgi:predicted phage terminase large subunit-like protein
VTCGAFKEYIETEDRQIALLEDKRARRLARDDLLVFTEYTHPNWTSGEHHRLICSHLEAVERGEIRRLMIFAPPRHSKSELATKRFPAWYLGRHPNHQIICASHTWDLARDFGAEVRDIVKDQWYRNVFPKLRLNVDAQAAGRWRTNDGGIYCAVGVNGAVTGRGAHIAVIDDPVAGRNDAESPRMRELAARWYFGDLHQRLMPGGAIVFMMTRWHEGDLAARVMGSEDWTILSLPAISNEWTDDETALWPEWWPIETLREKRSVAMQGNRSREWQAQYQQNPIPDTGDYIRREWFNERYEADKLPSGMHIYIASDFAVSEPTGVSDPDFTEHGVFGVAPDHRVYVLDWWYGQTESDVWVSHLLKMVQEWRPQTWFGEKGQIEKGIGPFLRREISLHRVYFRQEMILSTKSKSIRGRSFQAMASQKKIVFPRTEWAQRVIDQCVGFPATRYDDAFDVMSLMCLAIDEALPGCVSSHEQVEQKRDTWSNRESPSSWRTA